MNDEINIGEYLIDYYNSFANIMKQLEEANNIVMEMCQLCNEGMYNGSGLTDFSQFNSSLSNNIYKLYEFYKAGCSYIINMVQSSYEINAETTKVIEAID